VAVTSSNSWNTNLDNIVYGAASSVTPTPTPTPTGLILGNSEIGSQIDTGDSGHMNGSKFTTGSVGGTTQSMSVFVGNIDIAARSSYQMAIYSDNNGVPGTLVAHTSTGTLHALSWNTLPISANLIPNTTYWLMYNTNGRNSAVNNMYYNTGVSGAGAWKIQNNFGSWPSNFGSSTADSTIFSMYVSF
jgi:hypothetical protein